MAKEDKNQNLLIIAIVGIVAIVALMIFSRGGTGNALAGTTMTNTETTLGPGTWPQCPVPGTGTIDPATGKWDPNDPPDYAPCPPDELTGKPRPIH